MLFEDFEGNKTSFAKDPCVIRFQGRYYLYYTKHDPQTDLYGVGIAVTDDLTHYEILGVLRSELLSELRPVPPGLHLPCHLPGRRAF